MARKLFALFVFPLFWVGLPSTFLPLMWQHGMRNCIVCLPFFLFRARLNVASSYNEHQVSRFALERTTSCDVVLRSLQLCNVHYIQSRLLGVTAAVLKRVLGCSRPAGDQACRNQACHRLHDQTYRLPPPLTGVHRT